MPNLAERVNRKVNKAAGTSFWRKYLVTSSNVTVAQKALTGTATGDLMVTKVIFQTDATGLAGMTNFELGVSGETYGLDKPVVGTQATLGANAHLIAPQPAASGDTTNDNYMTVTSAVPFLLEAGDSLQYSGSGSAGTGAGVVAICIEFYRLADNADIVSAV